MRTAGAKINSKMIPLDTRLKNGDIVEIIVKKNSEPSAKWLDFVKTTFARRKIAAHLQTKKKPSRKNSK
jgi:(p)ppGpp synthase/HD superfamily hydrolase